jgi:hypothetical protein
MAGTMKALLPYILRQMKQASTWRGLVLALTSAGVLISEALAAQIVAFGLALSGLIGVFLPDALDGGDTAEKNRLAAQDIVRSIKG